MDDDLDVIGILERCCCATERGVVEIPLRGYDLPDELVEIVAVFAVAEPAAVRREIILVPPSQFGLRRQRLLLRLNIGNQITADRDQSLAPVRVECRHNVGRARSPIETTDDRLLDL